MRRSKAVRELDLSTCRGSVSFSFYTTDGQRQECLPTSDTNKSQCYLTLKKARYSQGTPLLMWLLCSTLSHLGKELTEEEVGRRDVQLFLRASQTLERRPKEGHILGSCRHLPKDSKQSAKKQDS